MKKILLLSALTLSLGFGLASCDDNDIIGIPQNPAEAVFEADGMTVSPSEAVAAATLDNPISLEQYNNEEKNISLGTVDLTNFPASYQLKLVMQISKDESFSRPTEVPVEVSGNEILVEPDALQAAYYGGISKGPKAKTIYARYAAYAVYGTTELRIGDPNFYYPSAPLNILPFPSTLVIEDNYYLLGTCNGWSVANALKFNHSAENVYDDPVFSIKVDVSQADIDANSGWWWKIVPESTYSTGDWVNAPAGQIGVETNGDDAMEGNLCYMTGEWDATGDEFTVTKEPGAGTIMEAGPMLITINMEEGTYEIKLAIEQLYTPGDANGWNQAASQCLYTTNYVDYYGFGKFSPNGFKFTSQDNWDGINYGAAEEGKLSTDGGAGNLTVAEEGFYFSQANIASLTYSMSGPITTLGLIGDATPGGWDASTALTPSADMLVWEGDVTFKGGEFKIRANNAWDFSLGGDVNNLGWDNAPNIASPGAGTKHVVLDLSHYPFTITFN